MRHLLTLAASIVLLASAAFAQDDEAKFNHGQADRLNKFAKNAFQKGFPRQAKLIWLQVLKLYDPNDPDAHKALGNTRMGGSWAPDPKFQYPVDDTGSGADAQALYKQFEALKKELAAAHRRQAQMWEKAGRTDKSHHHYQMVLRWVKDDAEAQKALDHHDVGGVTGTSLEQTLYDRSKMIEQAVAEESRVDYPVEIVDEKHPVLDRAQIPYVTAKSEHFVLHGDPGQEAALKQTLVWGERARKIMARAFPWEADVRSKMAFFTSKDTYKQILRANAGTVSDLEWKLEHTPMSGIEDLVVGAPGSEQVMYDAVVRQVARAHSGFRADGFTEGIGHTFVGMIFNQNRVFQVDLKKQEGTVATEEDREYTSPNFDIWQTLALEMAWKLTGGVAAIDLCYSQTANFSNEERIKAWSFCDYMMRRSPEMLRTLDALAVEARKTPHNRKPHELEAKFVTQSGGVTIKQLDKEWEDFWTEATPVLQAIRNNTPPLQAVSPGVERWLAAFNEVRSDNHSAPVTWSSNFSTRCMEHAEYLKANKDERGPAAEHRQLPDLGGTHLGSMFAQMAIVETNASPGRAKKMFESWLEIPGYRDAIVNECLRTVGIYSDGPILVMNVVAGLGPPRSKKAGVTCHPEKHAKGIPVEVPVAPIGPELQALLEQHGHAGKKVVGYPLSIHLGVAVPGDRTSYRCTVQDARGRRIEGAIMLDNGEIRRSSAPGMVTFYPFEPLPHGPISVTWSWEADGPHTVSADFTTK